MNRRDMLTGAAAMIATPAAAQRADKWDTAKLDEAVKTGAVLDCVIRHRLHVAGVANGQRVPEDWLAPDPKQLVAHALSVQAESVFDLDESELSLIVDGLSTQVGAKSTGSMHA